MNIAPIIIIWLAFAVAIFFATRRYQMLDRIIYSFLFTVIIGGVSTMLIIPALHLDDEWDLSTLQRFSMPAMDGLAIGRVVVSLLAGAVAATLVFIPFSRSAPKSPRHARLVLILTALSGLLVTAGAYLYQSGPSKASASSPGANALGTRPQ